MKNHQLGWWIFILYLRKTLVWLFAFYNIKIVAKKRLLLYNINKLNQTKDKYSKRGNYFDKFY